MSRWLARFGLGLTVLGLPTTTAERALMTVPGHLGCSRLH
jgi:hypothetical protein